MPSYSPNFALLKSIMRLVAAIFAAVAFGVTVTAVPFPVANLDSIDAANDTDIDVSRRPSIA